MTTFKDTRVPMWVALISWLLFAAAALVTIEVMGHAHIEMQELVKDILVELFKAIFIGVCVGGAVELYLKSVERRDEQEAVLRRADVKRLHKSRSECLDEFKRRVNDPDVKFLSIAGISLREFLRPNASMNEVWLAILNRLRDEEREAPRSGRFRVRLLVLDPKSDEGRFRLGLEKHENEAHEGDTKQALKAIKNAHKEIYEDKAQEFLQIKFYSHCPFSFMFITEEELFVEQYYYQDEPGGASPAVVEYAKKSPKYRALMQSFNLIWQNAEWKPIITGTAEPIHKAGIENIFREDQREALSQRQVSCIEAVESGTIDILAISSRHYVDPRKPVNHALLNVSSIGRKPGPVKVRIAIVNPVSQQAILRAVADDQAVADIRNDLSKWDWNKHRKSDLYQDVTRTRDRIRDWKKGHSFDLRLYSSSVANALLLTPKAMFVEQYIYGRTMQGGKVLRGEYPVIEFKTRDGKDRTEREIVASSFQTVWDYYSVSEEEYQNRSEKVEFQNNLLSLQRELGCQPPPEPDNLLSGPSS